MLGPAAETHSRMQAEPFYEIPTSNAVTGSRRLHEEGELKKSKHDRLDDLKNACRKEEVLYHRAPMA